MSEKKFKFFGKKYSEIGNVLWNFCYIFQFRIVFKIRLRFFSNFLKENAPLIFVHFNLFHSLDPSLYTLVEFLAISVSECISLYSYAIRCMQ